MKHKIIHDCKRKRVDHNSNTALFYNLILQNTYELLSTKRNDIPQEIFD